MVLDIKFHGGCVCVCHQIYDWNTEMWYPSSEARPIHFASKNTLETLPGFDETVPQFVERTKLAQQKYVFSSFTIFTMTILKMNGTV